MDDEGLGIAGWLFADLVLVLAFVFIALSGGDDDDAVTALAPTPTPTPTATPTPTPTPTPTATPTPSPTPTPTPTPALTCNYRSDLRFDQIVLRDITRGGITSADILNGYVLENRVKSQEGEDLDLDPDGWEDNQVLPFLWQRQEEGFRIALVETFSHDGPGGGTALSEEVNHILFETLEDKFSSHKIPILADEDVPKSRTSDYHWRAFAPGEVRINLFFVTPPDEDCE